MTWHWTAHLLEEAARRSIPRAMVEAILASPQQVVESVGGREVRQSLMEFDGGKMYLIRVIVDRRTRPGTVVTVYRTSKDCQALEDDAMKVTYDAETDILRIFLRQGPIQESDEQKPGLIFDYDKDGNVIAVEVLDASKRVENPGVVEHLVTG